VKIEGCRASCATAEVKIEGSQSLLRDRRGEIRGSSTWRETAAVTSGFAIPCSTRSESRFRDLAALPPRPAPLPSAFAAQSSASRSRTSAADTRSVPTICGLAVPSPTTLWRKCHRDSTPIRASGGCRRTPAFAAAITGKRAETKSPVCGPTPIAEAGERCAEADRPPPGRPRLFTEPTRFLLSCPAPSDAPSHEKRSPGLALVRDLDGQAGDQLLVVAGGSERQCGPTPTAAAERSESTHRATSPSAKNHALRECDPWRTRTSRLAMAAIGTSRRRPAPS